MSVNVDRSLELPRSEYYAEHEAKSVTRLVAANAAAYATGYDAAYASDQDLTRRYIAELNKPRITLGRSIGLIAAIGAGFVLGAVVHD